MKENPYFKESEFKCKCGKCTMPTNCPPDELIDILVSIREHYGKPVHINSGYRCPEHNAKVGGAPASRHRYGDAVDFRVSGVPTSEVHRYVKENFFDKSDHLGLAKKIVKDPLAGFVHLDTWRKRTWSYAGSLE